MPGLADCTSMDDYFLKYGEYHVENARQLLEPYHTPGVDPTLDFSDIKEFNPDRVPLPAQEHVITATVRGLQHTKGGFYGCEMGSGKTIMAMISAFKLLKGRGRVIVFCPDHIISKWREEIETTIPNAKVITFENWKEVIHYYWEIGDFGWGPKRWQKPEGMEFAIIGRDQSKLMPNAPNMGEEKNCFDGKRRKEGGSYRRKVGTEEIRDAFGDRIWDQNTYSYKTKPVFASVYQCPKCGKQIVAKKTGMPIDVAKSTSGVTCDGRYAVEIRDKDSTESGKDRIGPLSSQYADAKEGQLISPGRLTDNSGKKSYKVRVCGERLWNYIAKPKRWAPAQFMFRKMRGCFDLCIVDEIHEEKGNQNGDIPAQAKAAWQLMGISKKTLALTGTLIGGYAWHLFPLIMCIRPKGLIEEGIQWGESLPFSKKYGRVDRVVTISQDGSGGGSTRSRRSSSMRRVNTGNRREYHKIQPGVMPSLYARHLIGCSVFLSLNDLADKMPPLAEYIGCAAGSEGIYRDSKDQFWTNTQVEMSPELAAEVELGTAICKAENDRLLQNKSMKFLGATLAYTMEYPDSPHSGWEPEFMDHDGSSVPLLLGQSFLKNFDYEFDQKTETLSLEKGGECDKIQLVNQNGVYTIPATLNGKWHKQFTYDTGASVVSMSSSVAEEIGLDPKNNGKDSSARIADGSIVPTKSMVLPWVKVGRFSVPNVECSVQMPKARKHAVGYWMEPNNKTEANWVGVYTPKVLPANVVYPKELKLIEICKRERAHGNQVWVYCNMTGKRNVMPRLAEILEKEGLRVGILNARSVKPRERIAWIEKQGRNFDVMLSHPKPVMTGLDLLSKNPAGGHNYSALVFYQTGTHAFVCKQASRRAWRLIQQKKCRVYYLYYANTMQHHFVSFMAKKFAAMAAISGDFSMDGLIAMGGGDDGSLTLCKSISTAIVDDHAMQDAWKKAKGAYVPGDDEALAECAQELGMDQREMCEGIELQEESPAFADTAETMEAAQESAEAHEETFRKLAEDEAKELEILSEPLVEDLDLSEGIDAEDWDYSFTEEELELLNL